MIKETMCAQCLHTRGLRFITDFSLKVNTCDRSWKKNYFLEEPPVLTITPSEVMTILEGKQAQMKCKDKARKHLTVKWRRCDGGPYLNEHKDGLLRFEAVTRDHAGCYECEAQDASLRAELIVECE